MREHMKVESTRAQHVKSWIEIQDPKSLVYKNWQNLVKEKIIWFYSNIMKA